MRLKKLFELRKKNKKFKFLSFPTISGTGPNGAIIHYKAYKKTNRKLKKEIFILWTLEDNMNLEQQMLLELFL